MPQVPPGRGRGAAKVSLSAVLIDLLAGACQMAAGGSPDCSTQACGTADDPKISKNIRDLGTAGHVCVFAGKAGVRLVPDLTRVRAR
jgi:hypothetical protein